MNVLREIFSTSCNYRMAEGEEIQDIKAVTIITGPKWPEPVEIKRVDYSEDYIHIVGATTISTHHIDQLIPSEV